MARVYKSPDVGSARLRDIPVDRIEQNPNNPRIIFRLEELDELQESIRRLGLQVPISVYKERNKYVLIDGERRWRCCIKLNKKTIPALVHPKPTPLQNLLMMFNIHALREQWDLLTIALKLPEIVTMLTAKLGSPPKEVELVEETGLSRAVLRRCKLLMNLPDKYKDMILDELRKPKRQQLLTEDFFIEMEKALTSVERAMPDAIPKRDSARTVLIRKFKNDVIGSRIDFRKIAKIARAEKVEEDPDKARRALSRLFDRNDYSIIDAYEDSVSEAYVERDLLIRIRALNKRLDSLDTGEVDDELRLSMRQLHDRIEQFLEGT